MRSTAGIFALACALTVATELTALAAYPVLDQAHTFRGRISYVVHQADLVSAPDVRGDLTVSPNSWTLREQSPQQTALAGTGGATVDGGGVHVGVDDPLAAGSIANAWAVAIGTLATGPVAADGGDGVWKSARLRMYLDDARSSVVGLADVAGSANVSFAFDDWEDVGGMQLPQRVLRLRDGVPEASYSITGYTVTRAFPEAPIPTAPAPHRAPIADSSLGWTAGQSPIRLVGVAFPWRLLSTAFGLLLLAVLVVAWTRRDALIERVRRIVQDDPRGWTARGVSVFVSPEGRLHFDGAEYRVGAEFFDRMAVVQTSPLFLRVGSRDVPRAVVLARKFRPAAVFAGQTTARRPRSAHGFSLIETLVAVALFAMVMVGAVFPTLVVMARGDAIAATQEDAVRIAANALGDQEAACAYGAVTDGTVTSQIGQLSLTVAVGPSATGVAGASDIDVTVTDASGRTLAAAASTVGPAVPIPPPPDATPTPMSSGPSPPPEPSPSPSGWPG